VFEPRYQALVQACIDAEDHEFGTVLIERGSEVGGGDVRRAMGTVARMVQVAELDGGQYAVIAVGTHRMMVRAWLPDDPYPLADVDEVADEDHDPDAVDALLRELTPRVRRATALAMELGDAVADPQTDLSDDCLIASYQLSSLAPLGDVDRFDLLAAEGPEARLRLLRDRLGDVETLLKFRLDAG
jgi:Lon protease-like protein